MLDTEGANNDDGVGDCPNDDDGDAGVGEANSDGDAGTVCDGALGDPNEGCTDGPTPPDTTTDGDTLTNGCPDPDKDGAIPCNDGANEPPPFSTP